jgi:hypothetical protein
MTTNMLMVMRGLLIAATVVSALMAGAFLERSLVHDPAWGQLGAQAWAAFSLHADLGFHGAAYYPPFGIGAALLSIAAALSLHSNSSELRAVTIATYAGALFAVTGLLMTLLAAPNMLQVPSFINDPAGLQRLFAGFVFWGNIRGVLQTLAFFANLWALTAALQLQVEH